MGSLQARGLAACERPNEEGLPLRAATGAGRRCGWPQPQPDISSDQEPRACRQKGWQGQARPSSLTLSDSITRSNGRRFRYTHAVADLLEFGVQSGTLLFDGRRNGNQYSGTAYVFSKLCGALSYAVLGPASPDDRTSQCTEKRPTSARIVVSLDIGLS